MQVRGSNPACAHIIRTIYAYHSNKLQECKFFERGLALAMLKVIALTQEGLSFEKMEDLR